LLLVGIDPERFNVLLSHPACKQKQEDLRKKFGGKLLLVGRNRLDRINGVTKKFLAFEEFLNTYPQWKGKVCLVQIDEPPGTDESGKHCRPLVLSSYRIMFSPFRYCGRYQENHARDPRNLWSYQRSAWRDRLDAHSLLKRTSAWITFFRFV
jgi:hypothetical protein